MIETITQAASAIEHFLVAPSLTRAVIGGSIAAIAGTQWFKRWLWPALSLKISKEIERLVIVTVALVIGYVATDFLGGGLFLSAVVGISNPLIYAIAVKIIYRQWPWLEDKLSATPRKIVKTPDGYVERDITEPSAADEQTIMYRGDDEH